jgi:hypothetical protein
MSDFERRSGSSIICPYCDAEYGDAWEKRQDEGTQVCDDCGKKFNWERRVDVEYITIADCLINDEQHEYEDKDYWVIDMPSTSCLISLNKQEEFRIRNCKKCTDYIVERRTVDKK